MKISELTLDPVIDHPWSLVGKLMISSFPSSILRVIHVLIFMNPVPPFGIGLFSGMQRECCFASTKSCAYVLLSSQRHVSHSLHTLLMQRLLHQAKYVLCILDGLRCVTKCPCSIIVKSYHCLHMCH